MEGRLDPAALSAELIELSSGAYLADPIDLVEDGLGLFKPPARISTVEWAERYRRFRTTDGGALVPYDRWRTPYNIAKMDALDEPGVELVVLVKPSRSGGTTVAENYLGKMIDFGPMGDVGWYLGSGDAVKAYCDRIIKPLFEDHPRLAAKIGTGRSDNNDTSKRISGHLIEWLAANDANFRNREFAFGVMDEPDGWAKFGESAETQLQGRQKQVGRRRKGMIMSHPDRGWASGVAAAWESSSRGIYIMRCAECEGFAAAHATKHWPDVPQFELWYQKQPDASPDERIALAERTAGMLCPHCGTVHDDETRWAMVDEAGREGWWMHRGQTLDTVRGIEGEPEPHTKRGFWDHGLMLKVSPAAELARGLEEALIKYERSGGSKLATKKLREFMSKQLGEIFEGKAGLEGIDAAALVKRAKAEDAVETGMFPREAKFIVAAVDVGAHKFDVSFRAFDLESRSWWLDRLTLRDRQWSDGVRRNIATRERIEDWQLIIDEVVTRRFPIEGRPGWLMPVAAVAVDVGDGNVTWIGREFARRSITSGHYWGSAANPWSRVRLIQGSPSAKAPELGTPRKINRDERGREMKPGVLEYTVGAHVLKELALERLAIADGGPGQCYFAPHIEQRHYEELFNEPLIDGKFERQGPNESLDLMAYEEAVRLMLQPDRKDYRWTEGEERLPPWARPIPPESDMPAPEAPNTESADKAKTTRTTLDRFAALNRRT